MATAHLLHGFLGAGKTTLAKRLELEHAAVRFTPDEWMARLFGDDPPASIFPEKAAAIVELIKPVWTRCLALDVDVVLDFGFWRRQERDEIRQRISEIGAEARLYALNCSRDEAWRRIEARNAAADRSLYIAPATFDLLQRRFEPLAADEPHLKA